MFAIYLNGDFYGIVSPNAEQAKIQAVRKFLECKPYDKLNERHVWGYLEWIGFECSKCQLVKGTSDGTDQKSRTEES